MKPNLSFLLTLAFCIISNTATAQTKQDTVKTFKINYKVEFGAEDSENSKDTSEEESTKAILKRALMKNDEIGLTVYVNDTYLRVEEYGFIAKTQITNLKTKASYLIDSASKTATKFLSAQAKYSISENNQDGFEVKFTDETSTIAGYPVKKAQLIIKGLTDDIASEASLDIWYTESLPPFSWGEYDYLDKIPGAALSISINLGAPFGIKATEVKQVNLPVSFFELADDYTIYDSKYSSSEYIAGTNDSVITVEKAPALYNDKDYLNSSSFQLSNGIHWREKAHENAYRYAIFDANDKEIQPYKYTRRYPFSEGMAVVCDDKMQHGTVDRNGKEVIPCRYTLLNDSSEGLLIFAKGENYGVVTPKGEEIIPPIYEYIDSYHQGLAMVYKDGLYGYIDKKGKVAIPIEYDFASGFDDTGKAEVRKNGKYFYINTKGKKVE